MFEKIDGMEDKAQAVNDVVQVAKSGGFGPCGWLCFPITRTLCERLRRDFVGTASPVECARRRTAISGT